MNLFLSWSGDRSRHLAECLHQWIPTVLHTVIPWMSKEDISKGKRWHQELDKELEQSKCGVVCLTPENMSAPWLIYETGALSKTVEDTYVCTLLLDLQPAELVSTPFESFQHTLLQRDDLKRLMHTINQAQGEEALPPNVFENAFKRGWADLNKCFKKLPPSLNKRSLQTELAAAQKTIDRLIRHGQVPACCEIGKTFLNEKFVDESLQLFEYIREKLNPLQESYYIVLGNIAYAYNRKEQYDKALEYFREVELLRRGEKFFAWHAVALAYAVFKLHGKTAEYWKAIEQAQKSPPQEYKDKLGEYHRLYPEIVEDLTAG